MNGPGDIPLTSSSTPDTRPCGLISIIPTLGMSSCRGRAEAFARRLSSKLRTLGSQTDDDPTSQEDEPIINGSSANTWMTTHESDQKVTDLQPLRHESDSFFDFDCELESPGSPVDECEYLRLIETASNTPHDSAVESGYVCASTASSQNSSDGPYFDVESSELSNTVNDVQRATLPAAELPEYVSSLKQNGNATAEEILANGYDHQDNDERNSISEAKNDEQEEYSDLKNEQNHKSVPQNEQNHESATDVEQIQDAAPEEALPLSETDQEVAAATNHINDDKESVAQLSIKEMVNVQDVIISQLQRHSDEVTERCATPILENSIDQCSQTDAEVDPNSDASTATEVLPTESISETMHTITNGHSEGGEDILHIEMTEVVSEKPILEHNAVVDTESQSELPEIESNEQPTTESQEAIIEVTEKLPEPEEPAKTHHSVLDTDDEDDCRPQRVRRCSSLKTGKTPPGTPGRKKIVRFADVLGLDLADVKTFLDEVPTIPKSAFEDLEIMDTEPPLQLGPKSDKLLMPLFQQPGGLPNFLDIVREKQVSLENAAISDPINQTITGSVRVRNLDFHKSVHIRYTLDGWRSFADLQANYVQNSCDGFSDTFTFVLFGNSLQIGQRLEFAVRFQCKGQQFWDANYGTNYCFQCLPTSTSATTPLQTIVPSHHSSHIAGLLSPTAGDAWCSSFY